MGEKRMTHDNLFRQGLATYLPDHCRERLQKTCVGIAGAGGLGSNVACHLARSGIASLVVADCDRVTPSNLNRQFYFADQVGRPKVEALKENLLRIDPALDMKVHFICLEPDNLTVIFQDCELVVEALDDAVAKAMLVEALSPDKRLIVAASGIGGYGDPEGIRVSTFGKNIVVVGDGRTPSETGIPPMSPRVGIAAAMQADIILKYLIGSLTSKEINP
ncbi:sulfur carrier protein ThiS adenylyltransferase ThiF [Desulfobotulus sp. H1]|uniref:Sulfur carrier protein ThiS adenylyltransferase ThiF n=1 Tax=Desulfobotulus pelophilus TaxID=2823377 RepID=A0ABT3NBX4_9BACT|nr:sulfur carrier protein ThiS adenylyltransferase ThiF [Desulfobotulus pelophilus]MCW7754959.1 sulfur carrier protein ThiS adenylyltransferase ThiF [Desulfobotulus pelophilus]